MAVFDDRHQLDHARRAALAALAIQEACTAIAETHPGWPRFRVGVNTGQAAVGVLGSAGGKTYTVVGDTVNLAARLEQVAPVGGVAVGPETARRLEGGALRSVRPVAIKGKEHPVEVHLLIGALDDRHPERR